MRTTLDLDNQVLAAARAIARSRNVSLGRAVSELARRGLERGSELSADGFPTLPRVPGHLITDEMVENARDEG